jgi:hypothetical protein
LPTRTWYVRSISHDDDARKLPADIRTGMMAHRERIEAEYGRDELWKAIGPGHEEAWQYGYINGKLATLRGSSAASGLPGRLNKSDRRLRLSTGQALYGA